MISVVECLGTYWTCWLFFGTKTLMGSTTFCSNVVSCIYVIQTEGCMLGANSPLSLSTAKMSPVVFYRIWHVAKTFVATTYLSSCWQATKTQEWQLTSVMSQEMSSVIQGHWLYSLSYSRSASVSLSLTQAYGFNPGGNPTLNTTLSWGFA